MIFKLLRSSFVWCAAFILASYSEGVCRDTGHPVGMVYISGGSYIPMYKDDDDKERKVEPFYIDQYPVTNADYLEFVKANPNWTRSQVKRIFADETYLKHWHGDLDLGPYLAKLKDAPVTNVSWFSARAYAKWKGKRLPTLDEWEFVAAAYMDNPRGYDNPDYRQIILDWYSKPNPETPASVGTTYKNYWNVYDMHGLVWEWVSDYNSSLITGESRADSSLDRQLFCGSGAIGANDVKDYAAFMRYSFRSSLKAKYAVPNLGFRCCKDIESSNSSTLPTIISHEN